jgi:hypothetical protein
MSRPNSSGPSLSSKYHLLRSGRLTDCIAERLAEDAESKIRDEHEQHNEVASEGFLSTTGMPIAILR